MRNDSIERSVNASMVTIADYILQMIEQTKRQQELDIKKLPVDDELSLSMKRGEKSSTKFITL
ncbi:hypothetical protein [Bacillus sp. ISL-46]|uniref:hypothetical protein n=1 Tax=Bacillus sp. ISL-46 TaxID=2819129 RepID=UPI001BEB123D|nr:hypothetical protein [Bacillus sp. ISL-46]MBT2723323.1 hypothetical protein [Bacillus sp. ISL-46]